MGEEDTKVTVEPTANGTSSLQKTSDAICGKEAQENASGKEAQENKKVEDTPFSDRPVRERKSVERLVAVVDKDSSKDFHVEKGKGTPLKDIPNVAYKVSRKKSDEVFKQLHTILFGGRRGKATQIKANILRFSGYKWQGDEASDGQAPNIPQEEGEYRVLRDICEGQLQFRGAVLRLY